MKILLDECVPKKLGKHLTADAVRSVPECGWSGKKNGELPGLAQKDFDVFLTVDQNLRFQQNLSNFSITVVVLIVPDNRLRTLVPLVPRIEETLSTSSKGELYMIEAS